LKQLKLIRASALALLIALASTATAPVLAHQGDKVAEDSSSSNSVKVESSNQQTVTSDGSSQTRKSHSEVQVETTSDDDVVVNGIQLRHKAVTSLTELRKEHKTQTAEQRQKKCEDRKHGLTTKFSRIVSNSQRIQGRIGDVLDKALAYQQSNNLSPAGFDSLVAAAQTAKTTSQAAIDQLKTVQPTLDCSSGAVAEDVATFKAAAEQTRDSLKTYRTAVKNVLKALEAIKPTETEGSQQ